VSYIQEYRRKRSYWQHVGLLVGHIAASALIFVVVFIFGWGIGYIVHYLNGIQPLSDWSGWLVQVVELGFLLIDLILSGSVLVVGAWRFLHDVVRG